VVFALAAALVLTNLASLFYIHKRDQREQKERSELLNRIQGSAGAWSIPENTTPPPYVGPDDDAAYEVLLASRNN
jgi:hypothetical protein